MSARWRQRPNRYLPLFWRVAVPNAALFLAAGIALWIQPANGRAVVLGAGVLLLCLINLVITRRVVAPIAELTRATETVDPLLARTRIPIDGPESEATVLARKFNEMLDRLEAERREAGRRELRAQEAERHRVAAELHDQVGQNLTALTLLLQHLAHRVDGAVRDELIEGRDLAQTTVEDVRRVVRSLRPEALEEFGLVAAITSMCQRFADRTGLAVNAQTDARLPATDPDVELVLFRIAQESLTNAARHAGATRVDLALRAAGDGIELVVEDDGAGLGAAAENSHGGLRLMRERAALVGGRVAIETGDAGGVRVAVAVPNGRRQGS